MKTISESECVALLRQRGIEITEYASFNEMLHNVPFSNLETIKFRLPKDSGQKVALARLILRQFKSDSDILLWLKDWVVWPSSGHIPLLARLRQALGCSTTLEGSPCHLFLNSEMDDATSVLILSLEFFWDCLVINSDLRIVCFISHDEFYMVLSKERQVLAEIEKILENVKWGEKILP